MGVERRVWEREAEQPMNGWIRKAIAENDFCFVCLFTVPLSLKLFPFLSLYVSFSPTFAFGSVVCVV